MSIPDQPSNKVKVDLLPLQKKIPPIYYNKLSKRNYFIFTKEYLWKDTFKTSNIIYNSKFNIEYLGWLATYITCDTICKKNLPCLTMMVIFTANSLPHKKIKCQSKNQRCH